MFQRLLIFTAIAAVAAAAAVTAPAHAASPRASLLFVQNADGGSLTPVKGRTGTYTLRLRGVDAHALYFSDRPERDTGVIAQPALLDRLFSGSTPPNAAVEILGGTKRQDVMALELSQPRYERAKRTLTYRARSLKEVSNGLAHFDDRLDATLPRRFGAVSLFIDNVGDGNGCGASVTNASQGATFTIQSSSMWPTDHWDTDPGSKTWLPGSYHSWKSAGGAARGCNNTVQIHTGDGATITVNTGDPWSGSNTTTCNVTAPTIPGAPSYTCKLGPGSKTTGDDITANWIVSQG